MSRTTIAVDKETRDELYYQKQPGESYDEYLRRMCGISSENSKGGTGDA